jgi:hypothetical protein
MERVVDDMIVQFPPVSRAQGQDRVRAGGSRMGLHSISSVSSSSSTRPVTLQQIAAPTAVNAVLLHAVCAGLPGPVFLAPRRSFV